jgi:tungstate transport system ATP-binding protein
MSVRKLRSVTPVDLAPPQRHGILPLVLTGIGVERKGQRLLDAVTCELRAGSRTIVLGPNGAGKSLFLRICHGLIAPSRGTMQWRGPAAATAALRQAMVLQRPVMLRRTVAANVAYALALLGIPRRDRPPLVERALALAGLSDLAQRSARVLSGGEQQRLALARAWVRCPEVLFLDEPTASLDPAATRAVEDMVTAISAAGTKIIMTTHDLGQAHRLAEEVLFFNHGRLLEQAPAHEFFAQPRHRDAQAFVRGELLW